MFMVLLTRKLIWSLRKLSISEQKKVLNCIYFIFKEQQRFPPDGVKDSVHFINTFEKIEFQITWNVQTTYIFNSEYSPGEKCKKQYF